MGKVLQTREGLEPDIPAGDSNPILGGYAARGRSAARILFIAICAETVFSVPYRSVYLAVHSARLAWLFAVIVCGVVIFAFRQKNRITGFVRSSFLEAPLGTKTWVALWLVVGLVLRFIWVALFHVGLKSDGLAYFAGAQELAIHGTYSGAFWPPGLPLFLTPFLMIFGAHQWVTVLCAMLLFFVTYFITCGLAEGLAGSPAVRVAAPVLALWPGYLTVVGINSKEALLACLVTGAMLLYLRGTDRGRSGLLYFAAAGACIGFATLTQPGYMLFPGVILCYELLRSRGIWKSLGYTALFTLALVAVVAPWTYRNYLTFHRPVIVSTNGGSVFYRANNPDANASYAAEGANPLPQDEFAADKQGYKEAEAWIAHHPLDFLTLAVRKQVVYLGDDGIGIYESLKRDQNPPKLLYAALKAICSLYWIILWIVLLFAFINFPARTQSFTVYCLCAFPVVYQWGIDSVFESGSRHHIAYVGLIAALFGAVVANFPSGQEAPNQTGASLIQS